ncbi:membrane protein [Corynebacterium phocae]|uniref:Membrane protein n=1 Tax=Corynebacterium phocae TaxID=161895 RepID=A0A1L7D1P5_9CORY|nr:DUF3817 domain-containing protein [Corynebacterium phocae]APT92010.1 membrane protein [Corynebacterium phocae]
MTDPSVPSVNASTSNPLPSHVHPDRQSRVASALSLFSVMAWITGMFLIALVVRMVCQYVLNMEIPDWAKYIAIVHGWVYIAYVASVMNLGMKALWPFGKIILTALAGVVPFFSFFMESKRRREVQREFALL